MLEVKVDQEGNAVIPLGAALGGQEVRIVFEVGAPALSTTAQENNEIVPADEPLEGRDYHQLVASLFGSWDGDLFEPLDTPLDEPGPLF